MQISKVVFYFIFPLLISIFYSCRHNNEGVDNDKDNSEHAEDIHWDDDDDHEEEYETADHINNSASTNTSTSQGIPTAVLNSFNNKFIHSDNVKWKEVDGEYTASFEQENKKFTARYDKEGKWKGTSTEIEYEKLPQVIKESISKNNYKKDSIESIELVESQENNTYRLQYKQKAGENKSAEERKVTIDSEGNVKDNG